MNELAFINYLTKTIKPKSGVIRGIGDDAAVIDIGKIGEHMGSPLLLLASDMIIEGVHFRPDTDPFRIGWKAAAVNISDIAAMGGIPKYILMSVGVSKKRSGSYLKGIMKGAKAVADKFGAQIVGGDTNESKKTVVDVAIVGVVEKKCVVRRDTARPGDLIFVTGRLGEGRYKHLSFMPRVKEARLLARRFTPSSMIDISDGLCLDLTRVCDASGVGAVIFKGRVPVSDKARGLLDALEYGEDFELLFTVPASTAERLIKYVKVHDFPFVTLIGAVVRREQGLRFVSEGGGVEPIKPRGYTHFIK